MSEVFSPDSEVVWSNFPLLTDLTLTFQPLMRGKEYPKDLPILVELAFIERAPETNAFTPPFTGPYQRR